MYAVAIGRVSTSKQDVFGDSLDDQEKQIEIIKNRVEAQFQCKVEIVKNFPFSESASVDFESQPIQKVLTYIRESKIPIRFAFIKSIDRFTRAGAVVYQRLKIEFTKLGVSPLDSYHMMDNKEINALDHLGVKYWWSVINPNIRSELLEAEDSKDEVSRIQIRMIGASIRYVRLGYWRGAVPLGYMTKRVDTPEHGRRLVLVPNPEESKWFVKMFELASFRSKSDEEIVNEINLLGFQTRPKNYHDKENRNKVIDIKGNLKLTSKMLRKYLQNPIYAGVNTEHWLIMDGRLKPVYIKGDPIVSVDLFNKANNGKVTIVDEGGIPRVYKDTTPDWQKHKTKLNPKFPYKQYILCPYCKCRLKGSYSKGKLKRYPFYHCSNKHKYFGINGNKLEKLIELFIKKVKFSRVFIEKFEENFMKNWKIRIEQLNKNAIDWEKRIIDLRNQQHVFEEKLKMATTQSGFEVIERAIEDIKQKIDQIAFEESKIEDNEIDPQILTSTAKYWMEHFEELVLSVPNPQIKASLFGQIFEVPPTFVDLYNGTPKLSPLFALSACHTKGINTLGGIDETRTRNLFRAITLKISFKFGLSHQPLRLSGI